VPRYNDLSTDPILGCIVKSVTTFVAMALIVLLIGAARPDPPGAIRFQGVLAIASALHCPT
jgi:hypothetical protein